MDLPTSTGATVPAQISTAEVTWGMATKFWWAWAWRSGLAALGLGFVVGFIAGFLGVMLGVPEAAMGPVSWSLGAIVGIVSAVYFVKRLLTKDFGSFKVQIVRK